MKNYQTVKKLIALYLAVMMLLVSFSGCGEDKKKKTPKKEEIISTKVEDTDNEEDNSSEEVFPTEDDDLENEKIFEIEEETVINLSEYGAIPNDGKDDGDAIRRAIRKAGALEDTHVTIEFDKGVYNIGSVDDNAPINSYFSMDFKQLYNFTIKGNGSTLMMDDPLYSGFRFTGGGDITIDGLSIDYAIDPWAQGKVVAVNPTDSTFDIKVNNLRNGKSVLDHKDCWSKLYTRNYLTCCFGMVRDEKDPLLFDKDVRNAFQGMEKATKLSNDVYRIKINQSNSYALSLLGGSIHVGSNLVLNARINSTGVFYFSNTDGDITVTNCNVYASVGTISCIGGVKGNVTYDNVNVRFKDGRWTTSNADGFYSHGIRGKLSITNCNWEGVSDDYLNLFTSGIDVVETNGNTNVTILGMRRNIPEIGDQLTILDGSTGKIRGEATVTSVKIITDNPNLNGNAKAEIILDRDVKFIRPDVDRVINKQWQTNGTVIENNVFKYARNKCLKVNSLNTLIRGNTFENIVLEAITIHDYNYTFNENGCVNKCIIENNTFKNCAYTTERLDNTRATITIFGTRNVSGSEGTGYIHSNIKILNNEITNVYRNGIYISNAAKVTITGNKITGLISDGTTPGAAIYLNIVKQVKINGNTITDPRSLLGAAVAIQARAGKNITYADNVFKLADGVAQIDDRRSANNR